MSNSLWPHELQYARLPCPSVSSRVRSNSYPLSRWCYPAIASSVTPFPSFLHCSGLGSIPGWGTNIPQAKWLDRKEGKNKTLQSCGSRDVCIDRFEASLANRWDLRFCGAAESSSWGVKMVQQVKNGLFLWKEKKIFGVLPSNALQYSCLENPRDRGA